MKIRLFFVSNSSSSSFIITLKKGIKLEDKLNKIFSISKKHPLYHMAENVIRVLDSKCSEYKTYKAYRDEHFENDEVEALFKSGVQVFVGSVDDGGCGGDELESAVCHMSINYSDDECTIKKDADY